MTPDDDRRTTLEVPTAGDRLAITLLGHASLRIHVGPTVIYVDPWSKVIDLAAAPSADWIWITHDHSDHLDVEAIASLTTPATRFVSDPGSQDRLPTGHDVIVLRNGERATLAPHLDIAAVPAYNVVRGPYHPRGVGNGYVVDVDWSSIYLAADTECIPEMSQLGPIDVAFIPVKLPFTMSPEEAAACIERLAPRVAVPYHCGPADAARVAELLEGSAVDVRILIEASV